MKIVLILAAGLVVLVGLVCLIGVLLPRQHRVAREIALGRSPRDVFAVVRDFRTAPSWRRHLRSVEMLAPADGHTRFREAAQNGSVTYEVMEEIPDTKLVTRILDRDLGYSGSWTYEFLPTQEGTRLRITEDGEVSNILFRFMSRFVFGQTKSLETYLKALGAKFGQDVTPQ
ncbi:MAG: SRPBCC family protein [Spartobacteria bacterium]